MKSTKNFENSVIESPLLRASHRLPANPFKQLQKNPPTPFGVQLPAFKHGLSLHTSTARVTCSIVVVIIICIVLVVVGSEMISSQRAPVKFRAQTQIKPPVDVSEHVPPLKQGRIEHGLGRVVTCNAKKLTNWLFYDFIDALIRKPRSQLDPK